VQPCNSSSFSAHNYLHDTIILVAAAQLNMKEEEECIEHRIIEFPRHGTFGAVDG
jgi:hypothetical protein